MRARLLLAVTLSLALCPAVPDAAPASLALLAAVWLALLALATGHAPRAHTLVGAATACALTLAWVTEPRAWTVAAALTAVAVTAHVTLTRARPTRGLLVACAGVALPLSITLLAAAAESDGGLVGDVLRPLRSTPQTLVGVALAAWVGLALVTPDAERERGVLRAAALGGLLVLSLHARWFASVLLFPSELRWSEAPLLLNLLKLEVGAPLYGPLRDCNGYVYSPLLELTHHALLSPFGRSLDLISNRLLLLGWHAGSAALLCFALWPRLGRSAFSRTLAVTLVLLVVSSSFIAPNLHPDAPLVLALSAAIALVLRGDDLPRPVFFTGLVVVPVVATAAKLTGAGVGLGLVLAFALRRERKALLALGAGGIAALATIPLFDATLGHFSDWTLRVMAAHPLHAGKLGLVLTTPGGRVAIVLLAAFVAVLVAGAARPASRRFGSAPELVVLTLPVTALALVGFLKEGGRENSLLPLSIAGAAALVELAYALPAWAKRRAVLAPAALAVALLAAPPREPLTAEEAALAGERVAVAADRVARARAAGEQTLLYDSTLPWLLAGERAVPLDRWQSVAELATARHPAADEVYRRLESGHYDTVILSSHVLSPLMDPDADRLRAVLERRFTRVSAPRADGQLEVLVYRYRR